MCDAPPPKRAEAARSFRPPFACPVGIQKAAGFWGSAPNRSLQRAESPARKFWAGGKAQRALGEPFFKKGLPRQLS